MVHNKCPTNKYLVTWGKKEGSQASSWQLMVGGEMNKRMLLWTLTAYNEDVLGGKSQSINLYIKQKTSVTT